MRRLKTLITAIIICSLFTGCNPVNIDTPVNSSTESTSSIIEDTVPDNDTDSDNKELIATNYTGEAYIVVNDNIPYFTDEDYTTKSFEHYSELDELGRCGVAYVCVGQDIMPTEERGAIGQVKPAGWHTIKYDCVDGKYLYNRCHLIGYQLTGENANENNLITGTRYLNIDGMLETENMIAEYVEDTGNHVLYRVTPIYTGDNLLCEGLLMEGYSVEDSGAGIQFNIFAYNVQPGIEINYLTGESWQTGEEVVVDIEYTANPDGIIYVINIDTQKYHLEDCRYAKSMSEENREEFNGTKDWLEDHDYVPCGVCKP